MNKKIRILLVFLGIVSLSTVGLAGWIYFSAQTEISKYARKQAELEKQGTYLQKKLDAAQKEARRWQGKSESVTAALNKLGKEHMLIQSQYTAFLKEKDSLAEENRGLSEQLEKLQALYSEEQKKPKIDASDKFLSSLLEEKATLQVEVEKFKEEIKSVRKQVRPSQEKLTQLEKEKKDLETKLKDIEKVSDVLSNDLLQERRKRAALEEELAKTKKKQPLEQKPAEGTKRAAPKTESPSIELSPIVVKADKTHSQPTKLDKAPAIVEEEAFELKGEIITVNDKHRFVVIDIGRDAGVKEGMPFNVYRRGEKVGKIEVLETRENIAACDIKEMKVRRLKVNDTVRR